MQAEAEARFRALPGVSSQIIGAMRRAFSPDASAPRDKELGVRLLNYITLGGDFYVVLQNKGLLQENVD